MIKILYTLIILIILAIIIINVYYFFNTIENFTTVYVTDDRTKGKYGITCQVCPGNCALGQYITGSCVNNTRNNTKSCETCITTICPAGEQITGSPCTGSTTNDRTCVACPKGTYKKNSDDQQCLPCPSGTYQSEEGSLNCIECSEGTYQKNTGATNCIENLVYDFSSKTNLNAWTDYVSEIGGTTNITHYYTANQLSDHGNEAGVFKGGWDTGYFQLELPNGYNRIKIRYRNVYNNANGIVKIRLGGPVIRERRGLGNTEETPWFPYTSGIFRIEEHYTTAFSANLRLEFTYNNHIIYDFSSKADLNAWINYVNEIGGTTNITNYYLHFDLSTHGKEPGVFAAGATIGYFKIRLPDDREYNQVRCTYRNVYNNPNGTIKVLIGTREVQNQSGMMSDAVTTPWYDYNNGDYFQIQEHNSAIFSAYLNIEIK